MSLFRGRSLTFATYISDHGCLHAGATQVSFGPAVFRHESTSTGLRLSCSLEEGAAEGSTRGVKAACLCTAMVERLAAGATPVPEEKLKQVWGLLLDVFGSDNKHQTAEDMFQEEYLAARGQPMSQPHGTTDEQMIPNSGHASAHICKDGEGTEDSPVTPTLKKVQVQFLL